MDKQNLIVVGANSAISKSCVSARMAKLGKVALCGRDTLSLKVFSDDLRSKYPNVEIKMWTCDIKKLEEGRLAWLEMVAFCQRVDAVVVAPGVLGDQAEMEAVPELCLDLLMANSSALSVWVLWAANALEKQRHGALAVITSVAGMRGRASNYIYGSSKAQLIALAEGLRCRLARCGVRVIDFRPGMVATPMTAHLKRSPLMATATDVGGALSKALDSKSGIVYAPVFWRAIMLVINWLPFSVFKRLRF